MKRKKLLILFSAIAAFFVAINVANIYPVIITDIASQHPHYYAPKTKQSHYSLLYGVFPFILELPEETDCKKFAIVKGKMEKVVLGDGSGTSKGNYSAFHMYGSKVYCIK